MDEYKISAEEFAKTSIARLASHPNSSTAFGESKMSEADLKSRFDKQGELFRKKFNAFLDIIRGAGDGESLSGKILTGIEKDHTLKALFEDIVSESGRFASYLSVGDMTLMQKLQDIADNYVPRVKHGNEQAELLAEDKDGEVISVPFRYGADPDSVARRQAETGALKVGDPVADDEAVTRGYLMKVIAQNSVGGINDKLDEILAKQASVLGG